MIELSRLEARAEFGMRELASLVRYDSTRGRAIYRLCLAGWLSATLGLGCDCGSPMPRSSDGSSFAPDGASFDSRLVGLRIEPVDAVVDIVDGAPGSVVFRAIASFESGERDVSDEVSWSVGPSHLGSFRGPTFTALASAVGHGEIRAQLRDARALARVRIRVQASHETGPSRGAPPLPPRVSSRFSGSEDSSRSPRLLYPNDGVVLPPNLRRLEVHWLRGPSTNTVFDVRFHNDLLDVHVYTRCERPEGIREDGCIFELSGEPWRQVAETGRGRAPVRVTVRATDEAGTSVGSSETFEVRFARDDLAGTIYYWATTSRSVKRFEFAGDMARAEAVLTPAQAEGRCVGCHSLSRDGRRIVASVGGIGQGGMLLYDLEDFRPLRAAPLERIVQFASFAPDGNQMVGVYGDDERGSQGLVFFDTRCDATSMASCGMPIANLPVEGREVSHPAWSPDGASIAYTDVGIDSSSQRPLHCAIGIVRRSPAGWGHPEFLVPRAEGRSRYNPDWSPDGSLIVFNESICPGGDVRSRDCNGDSDPSASVWVVPSAGGTPVELIRAMAPGVADDGRTEFNDTFPRWAPFEFILDGGDAGDRRLMWVSFASTRAYGLRAAPGGNEESGGRGTYLWMTAILPDAALRGEDPSFPAFALPFQDLDTSNHIAVWTTRAVGEVPF